MLQTTEDVREFRRVVESFPHFLRTWDDRVVSRAIAVQMRKHLPAKVQRDDGYAGAGMLAPLRW